MIRTYVATNLRRRSVDLKSLVEHIEFPSKRADNNVDSSGSATSCMPEIHGPTPLTTAFSCHMLNATDKLARPVVEESLPLCSRRSNSLLAPAEKAGRAWHESPRQWQKTSKCRRDTSSIFVSLTSSKVCFLKPRAFHGKPIAVHLILPFCHLLLHSPSASSPPQYPAWKMTTYMLLSGKAGAAKKAEMLASTKRLFSTFHATAASHGPVPQPRPTETASQRELFMDVLSANATKRDAKQYLARFNAPKQQTSRTDPVSPLQEQRNARHRADQDRLERLGVNLGGLYSPARAIAESPQFTREVVPDKATAASQEPLHVALVCLRDPQGLDDATLDGVALTLSQLVKLGMHLALALDCGVAVDHAARSRTLISQQAERVNKALARHSPAGTRVVNGTLELSASGEASVALPKLLLDPLERGLIPIVPGIAYTPSGQLKYIAGPATMLALTNLLSGLSFQSDTGLVLRKKVDTSLDRIIVLDSAGGIPSRARGDGAHVFINLEQESSGIDVELAERHRTAYMNGADASVFQQHKENLHMSQDCLRLLPSASSALIITPQEAASSSQSNSKQDTTIGAGTRRQKNTLIHNLLTNKPLVSSSLPTARIPSNDTGASHSAPATPTATLLKRGMPLTIIPSIPPAESHLGWQPPTPGIREATLDLETDPRVDLPRLVHLIEDSFRRKLDVQHYLARIRNRTAGLIIAGEYEGAAILTWETPPSTNPSTTPIPYLDKFAVLSTSQGSSGVADILFQAMVRTCFPQGVCWRSRADNPVNKWYFERSAGTWRIPGSNWMMFWTGEGVVEDERRWREYVGVCESIGPSWADGGKGRKPD